MSQDATALTVEIPKPLKFASQLLEWFAIMGSAVAGGIIGAIASVAVFHFLKARTSVRRAWVGIAISLLPATLSGIAVYQRVAIHRQLAARAAHWEGVASPPFSFVTLDGQRVDSSQLRGKRVLLNFWATWCPACRAEIPEINQLVTSSTNADVAVFGISHEDESVIRTFLSENPVGYPVVSLAAQRLPAPYDRIALLPTSFVIDRNGVIQFIRDGYLDGAELKAAVWEGEDYQGSPRVVSAE